MELPVVMKLKDRDPSALEVQKLLNIPVDAWDDLLVSYYI